MKRTRPSEKSNNSREKSVSTSSGNSKSTEPKRVRRRATGQSTGQAANSSHSRESISDISHDENEEPQPAKRRRVSAVHSYAKKISNVEYECTVCSTVIHRFNPSLCINGIFLGNSLFNRF